MSQVLAKLDQAARMLAEVSTVQEATEIADVAHAAHAYAKRAKLGREAQTRAASIRFQAERKAGEFLGEMEFDVGGRPKTGPIVGPVKETLEDLGLTKNESSRFQLLAKVPEGEFLGEMGLHGGDRKSTSKDVRLKLDDMGLTWNESSRFQLLSVVLSSIGRSAIVTKPTPSRRALCSRRG